MERNVCTERWTSNHIKYKKCTDWKFLAAKKRSALQQCRKEKRFASANGLIQRFCLRDIELEQLTFVDEKRFLLSGPDNVLYYWDRIGNVRKVIPRTAFCPGITVWAGIGCIGKPSIFITSKTVNFEVYQTQHSIPE